MDERAKATRVYPAGDLVSLWLLFGPLLMGTGHLALFFAASFHRQA